MIKLDWIQEKTGNEQYYYSRHADQERQNDNVLLSEVEEAILSGRILEQYEDSGRGESCLLVGFAQNGKPLHLICGRRGNWLVIVTVYVPSPPKFKSPFERG